MDRRQTTENVLFHNVRNGMLVKKHSEECVCVLYVRQEELRCLYRSGNVTVKLPALSDELESHVAAVNILDHVIAPQVKWLAVG